MINLNNKLDKKHIYILISAIIAFHEILAHFHIYSLNPFFNYILSYLIGYGIVTFIGIMLNDMSHIEKKRTSIIFLGIYLTLATIYFYIDGAYRFTGTMKYPPHLYFISYALAISFFLITLLDKLKLNRISIITFISSSTLWIYLWHIPFIYIMNLFFNQNHWIINYIVVVILSVIIVYIQNKIIKILETKNVNNKILKIFKG